MTVNRKTGKAMNQQFTDKHEQETYENMFNFNTQSIQIKTTLTCFLFITLSKVFKKLIKSKRW